MNRKIIRDAELVEQLPLPLVHRSDVRKINGRTVIFRLSRNATPEQQARARQAVAEIVVRHALRTARPQSSVPSTCETKE